jgi:hypothetical protein
MSNSRYLTADSTTVYAYGMNKKTEQPETFEEFSNTFV